jgi:hypothetical protein
MNIFSKYDQGNIDRRGTYGNETREEDVLMFYKNVLCDSV